MRLEDFNNRLRAAQLSDEMYRLHVQLKNGIREFDADFKQHYYRCHQPNVETVALALGCNRSELNTLKSPLIVKTQLFVISGILSTLSGFPLAQFE